MRILIAGGGIGGLAAALSLHAAGLNDVQVFESAAEVLPIGVGVNLPPHAVRELTELGLADVLAHTGVPTAELAYYGRDGQLIWTETRGSAAGYHWPQYSIHRGRLQLLLLEAVRERLGFQAVHTGRRVMRFDRGAQGITLQIKRSDGTHEQVSGDVLIGADGIRSSVRAQLFPNEGPLPWNGWVMYRGRTWAPAFLTGESMVIIGDEVQRVVAYPISAPRADGLILTNWILTRRADYSSMDRGDWNRAANPLDLRVHVQGWTWDWIDVAQLITQAEEAYVYPLVDLEPLARWSVGAVTLLGDAAHAMYPFGSNGASQAILDGRYLARELASCANAEHALAQYEACRRETTTQVQLANRRQASDVMTRVSELARQHATGAAAGELMAVEAQYKRLAGFDADTLNTRASLSVSHTQ